MLKEEKHLSFTQRPKLKKKLNKIGAVADIYVQKSKMKSLLQCNYTFKYWVILINYMYLLYG